LGRVRADLKDQRRGPGFDELEVVDHSAERRHRAELESFGINAHAEQRILESDYIIARYSGEEHVFLRGFNEIEVAAIVRVENRDGEFILIDAKLLVKRSAK